MTPPIPEDPKHLMAELESARLALRARPKSQKRGVLLLLVIILLGALLALAMMMGRAVMQERPLSKETSWGRGEAVCEKLLCAEGLSPLESELHPLRSLEPSAIPLWLEQIGAVRRHAIGFGLA